MESVERNGEHILWKYYREKQYIKKGKRKKGRQREEKETKRLSEKEISDKEIDKAIKKLTHRSKRPGINY